MSEMVEQVARGMYDSDPWTNDLGIELSWTEFCRENVKLSSKLRSIARAGIAAMRMPTPEMIAATAVKTPTPSEADYTLALDAARITHPSDHPDVADILSELVRDWRTMIAEALR